MTLLQWTGGVVGGSCWFADASEFVSFMHLKMVLCVSSDDLDDVFRCVKFQG